MLRPVIMILKKNDDGKVIPMIMTMILIMIITATIILMITTTMREFGFCPHTTYTTGVSASERETEKETIMMIMLRRRQ